MKNYYVLNKADWPSDPGDPVHKALGIHHMIDLSYIGGGQYYFAVVFDELSEVPASWIHIGHLLDASPIPASAATMLQPHGVLATDSTFKVAMRFASINKLFLPG